LATTRRKLEASRLTCTTAFVCARRVATVYLLAIFLAVGLGPKAACGQSDVINREYPLKALFLYNFGSYIDWPAGAVSNSEPFVIGILGPSPVELPLREIGASHKINGRPIVVEQFASVDAIKPCHILFIPLAVGREIQQQAIARVRGEPVLVVGESPGFAARGGVVNFFIEANKIRFEVNVDAALAQRLKISAKLLALAKIVAAAGAGR
jgi:hypothetical protein